MSVIVTRRADAREWDGLNDLIGHIYECAIDPGQWDDTLVRLADQFGPQDWDTALLMWERLSPPGGRFIGAAGLVPLVRQVYLSTYVGRTPWSRRLTKLAVGRVVDSDEIMPRAEHTHDAFYQNFLKTWRMEIAVGVVLDRRGRESLGLLMPGPPDHDVEGLKRALRILAPHLQRAVRISRALGETSLRAAAAEEALERAPVAIATLTPELQIVNANARLAGLADSGLLSVAGGRFVFFEKEAQARLVALAKTAPPASAAFSISGPARSLKVLAARFPTHTAGVFGGAIEGAGIVISIGVGAGAPPLEIDRLRAWYGLTRGEAKLAAVVARGEDLAEHAALRAISMNAVRFHLKGIFRKTGAASQAQLVAKLLDLPLG